MCVCACVWVGTWVVCVFTITQVCVTYTHTPEHQLWCVVEMCDITCQGSFISMGVGG